AAGRVTLGGGPYPFLRPRREPMRSRLDRLALLAPLLLTLPLRGGGPPSAADGGARTDRYGDPLPPGALARLGTVRFRHTGEVTAVAFAPDSKTVASAGGKGIHLWEVATGKELRQFQGHPAGSGACSLAFSP